ncbi:MAG TPA: DUF4126 domain-containing protein [Ignavibacteriaceae bacterium]|nr:DUF4126 domain-containing protein [Ignavibacteriaceae bacterium]
MILEIILTIFMGLGLSAAAGFRIFVPFLIISIASLTGYLNLSESFSWIGTIPALVTFSIATCLEIAAYYIPWVDNMLDTIASPIAVVAGMILMASVITGMSPLLKWSLAIIAGGGISATIQGLTGTSRAASSVTTGGLGNPVLSTVEIGGAITMTLLAIFLPIAAMILVIILCIWTIKILKKKFFLK